MSEWRETVLGEALDVKHGYAFKGQFFSDVGQLIVLTPGNFHEAGGFKSKSGTEKYYLGPVPDGYLLQRGDVVVAMTEQAQGLLGSSATIPEDGRYLHNQRIGLLRILDDDRLDLRFCYHLMNTRVVRHQIQATATGSKVRHTAPERIRAVRALLPSICTQRVIAEMLDSLDSLIENNRLRIELLEQMVQVIYREWLVRFRFPGHEDISLVDSPLGPVPRDWAISPINDLVDVVRTTVHASEVPEDYPAVGLEHIPRRQLTLDAWGEAGDLQSRKTTFRPGDILFGKIRPYFHKVSVAPLDGICSTDAIVVRPSAHHWGLAALALFSDDFVAQASQTATGTKMPRADWKVIGGYLVAIPPETLSAQFTELARSHLDLAKNLMFTARSLTALRDLLLPKLVSGQIDLSNLDLEAAVASVA
jgi:type I restriction enzyme, S subunit